MARAAGHGRYMPSTIWEHVCRPLRWQRIAAHMPLRSRLQFVERYCPYRFRSTGYFHGGGVAIMVAATCVREKCCACRRFDFCVAPVRSVRRMQVAGTFLVSQFGSLIVSAMRAIGAP